MTAIIPALSLESRIKRRLRDHLRRLGFVRTDNGQLAPPSETKESLRVMHRAQREELLKEERGFIKAEWPSLEKYFANGDEIEAARICPRLEIIAGKTWQSRLFRLAGLTWSVPVSEGYGRRMRFLVWDEQNGKLIGLIALGDPVFNLKVRDELIGWSADDRRKRLVNVLDAYVLGALPPYNQLLCGKLVACLIKTREIRDAFAERYAEKLGIISQEHKRASLCLVTTSSALGRSSVYNRLSINGQRFFESIGYTSVGQLTADAQQGFPIPDYPMCIQRAHDFAKLTGLEIAVLQDLLLQGICQKLSDEETERLLRLNHLGQTLANLRYKEA